MHKRPGRLGLIYINCISHVTRILFIWFFKEKKLVPDELFDEKYIKEKLLKNFDPQKKKRLNTKTRGSAYYRAILQNLFFATLNQTMGNREFRKAGQNMNVTNLMRYETYFKDPERFIQLVEDVVPFMNGGLFECLDKPDPECKGKQGGDVIIYQDGFSDRDDNMLIVPDYIFFGLDEQVDLSEEYGSKATIYKNAAVKGLINILKSYKFTITENTPIEEDIALDPELLGKVFENLLASYNPETKTTARKQTGSFYTPREIVNYMVDESLITYLKNRLFADFQDEVELDTKLHQLFSFGDIQPFDDDVVKEKIISALDKCKILDPACGSGAFPMGILQKMVLVLNKLDPNNEKWKQRQIEKAELIDDADIREKFIIDIEEAFNNNELDYGRKLYLIENCIYGVDIQSIAIQISKLRFFISLIVDQKVEKKKENSGIRPLPNLETKFVAANTLIGIEKSEGQMSIFDNKQVLALEKKLKNIRSRLFNAKTPKKKRELREEDKEIREKMRDLLIDNGWDNYTARQLADWDPYDQNTSSPFFDSEWMFDMSDGFDVVIGNPPYVSYYARRSKSLDTKTLRYYQKNFDFITDYTLDGKFNTVMFFLEHAIRFINSRGIMAYIIDVSFFDIPYRYIRKYLLENTKINYLMSNISHFENVYSEQLIIQCEKDLNIKQDNLVRWFTLNGKELDSCNIQCIAQKKFYSNEKYEFKLPLRGIESSVISKMERHKLMTYALPGR